jgi:N-acetylglucosaminyl-diphospho-decaprenol L-rhamnosyltransferase|tara:strand:+ start:2714 stop:3607 length:894 start_codon:yes stop_codon:yes gene_type:complete
MSISTQNLSIVIVAFKSESVIHQCIASINSEIKIVVIENSNNEDFKNEIEKKYTNVKCYLSSKNIGMGAANNFGIDRVETDYVFVLNPDVILENSTIDKMILASKSIESFVILSPLLINENYPNYKISNRKKNIINIHKPFKVSSVDGFAMLLNKKKIKQFRDVKNPNIFDENFFMYLENDDLCKRIISKNENIYIVPNAKINHLGGKAVNEKYQEEIELSRNWHWIWSKFYFNKKHYGFLTAFLQGLPTFISAISKILFYFIINNKIKKKIYLNRYSGYLNGLLGRRSWYRPKIKD